MKILGKFEKILNNFKKTSEEYLIWKHFNFPLYTSFKCNVPDLCTKTSQYFQQCKKIGKVAKNFEIGQRKLISDNNNFQTPVET